MNAGVWVFMLSFSLSALGQSKNLPPIGEHYPVFVVEKNENPENIMIAYVKLDKHCRFVGDPKKPGQPLFDFYWLMNRERYKRVHPLIKAAVRERLEVVSQSEDRRSFDLRLNDLRELKSAPRGSKLVVEAKTENGHCSVNGVFNFGKPGDEMKLLSIYSDARKSIWPPFRKLNSVRLSGLDPHSQKKLQRTFSAN